MLLIFGEKGVGKTSFLSHIIAHALSQDFLIMEAQTSVWGSRLSYSLLRQLIEGFSSKSGRKPPSPKREAWGGVAGLGMEKSFEKRSSATPLVLLPWDVSHAMQQASTILKGLTPDRELGIGETQDLFDKMLTLITAETKSQKILVVVDNLHDLDSGSLSFLWFLCRNNRSENLRIAATALPKEGLPPPIRSVIDELIQHHALEEQVIPRLDEGETYRLLESLPEGAPLTPAVKQYLYSASKGNPRTIVQLLQGISSTAGRSEERKKGGLFGLLHRRNMLEVRANTSLKSGSSGTVSSAVQGSAAGGTPKSTGSNQPEKPPNTERYYPSVPFPTKSAQSTEPPTRTSVLQETLLKYGAKMVTIAGWSIPFHYVNSGIVSEYNASLKGAGMFDHSHFGILEIEGAKASQLLSKLTTTNAERLGAGSCRTALMLDDSGRLIDEITILCLARGPVLESFVVLSSPPSALEVRDRLLRFREEGTKITDWGGQVALFSLAGPKVPEALQRAVGWDLSPLKEGECHLFSSGVADTTNALGTFFTHIGKEQGLICRSRRFQEAGVDILVSASFASRIWDVLAAQSCLPCGYGAGEILTLEQGRLSFAVPARREHTPLESAMEGTLEMDHDFIGRAVVEKQNSEGITTRLVGVIAEEHGAVPRPGSPLLSEEVPVGEVVMGGFSPRIDHGIALAYLPVAVSRGERRLTLDLRPRKVTCRITSLPFL
jgi:aminomethyltransferase